MSRIPSPTELEILALLSTGEEQTGRELASEYRREAKREIPYGTLYVVLRRIHERRWISIREAEDGDGRFRYYRITANGRRALERGRERYAQVASFRLAGGSG